jgi:hypothetical protein
MPAGLTEHIWSLRELLLEALHIRGDCRVADVKGRSRPRRPSALLLKDAGLHKDLNDKALADAAGE